MLELLFMVVVIVAAFIFISSSFNQDEGVKQPMQEKPKAEGIYKSLSPHHKKAIKEQGLTIVDFTCTECSLVSTCPSSYDLYNTNGDCLEEK